jgi:hypothetical protein
MKRFIPAFLFLLLIGCAVALPMITQDDVPQAIKRWPQTSLQELSDGRAAYVNHCSGCHSLHVPGEFSEEQWHTVLEEMKVRSRITPEQKELIFRYLAVVRMKKNDSTAALNR